MVYDPPCVEPAPGLGPAQQGQDPEVEVRLKCS